MIFYITPLAMLHTPFRIMFVINGFKARKYKRELENTFPASMCFS